MKKNKLKYIFMLIIASAFIVFGVEFSSAMMIKIEERLQFIIYKTKAPFDTLYRHFNDIYEANSSSFPEHTKYVNKQAAKRLRPDYDSQGQEMIFEFNHKGELFKLRFFYEEEPRDSLCVIRLEQVANSANGRFDNMWDLKTAKKLFEDSILKRLNIKEPIRQQPTVYEIPYLMFEAHYLVIVNKGGNTI